MSESSKTEKFIFQLVKFNTCPKDLLFKLKLTKINVFIASVSQISFLVSLRRKYLHDDFLIIHTGFPGDIFGDLFGGIFGGGGGPFGMSGGGRRGRRRGEDTYHPLR